MEVGQHRMSRKRASYPTIPLAARGPKNCLGSGCFGAQTFGIDEGQYVEVSNKNAIFAVFFAKFHSWFLGHV